MYDQVVKLIEDNPEKSKKWVEETGDDNMIYMLVDNVKYNKDMTKNADYYDERLKEDEDNTNDFIKYMGTGDDIHLGGFPGKNIMEGANKVLLNEQEDVLGDIYDAEKHFSQYGYKMVNPQTEHAVLQKRCGNVIITIRIDGAGKIYVNQDIGGSHPSGSELEQGTNWSTTLKEIESDIRYGFTKYSFAIKDCEDIFKNK